jgi:hypothetical protein
VVRKRTAQKFDAERFNFKNLNDVEVEEVYLVKISNRFADWENMDHDDVDIYRVREVFDTI